MQAKEKTELLVLAQADFEELSMLDAVREIANITVASDSETARHAAAEAEAILVWDKKELLKEIFPEARSLKWVHGKFAGIDSLLFPELVESDVVLTNAAGVYALSLSEFAIFGMLYFAKDAPRMLENKKNHRWEQFKVQELAGQTLGIFGYGAIGQEVAKKARVFGMRVVALRRTPERSAGDPAVDVVFGSDQKAELIAESDFLVIAAPGTSETTAAFGSAEFSAMKDSAVLINIGRGTVVVEDELIAALENEKIRGVALDVFEQEPLSETSKLWDLPNVFLSPHTADQTATWLQESMQLFLDNFKRYRKDQSLYNICDKKLGY